MIFFLGGVNVNVNGRNGRGKVDGFMYLWKKIHVLVIYLLR